MSVAAQYLYYDYRRNRFVDPWRGWMPVTKLALTRRDLVYLRLQVLDANKLDDVKLASTGKASNSQLSISDQTLALVGVKPCDHDDTTDYEVAFSGYTASDSSWHALGTGNATLAVVIPSTVDADDDHKLEIELRTAGGSRWTLGRPLDLEVVQEINVGGEPSSPAGVTPVNYGTATITAPADNVTVTYSGMTASGVVIPSLLGTSNLTALSVTCGTNSFTITAGAVPDTTWTVGYYVVTTG